MFATGRTDGVLSGTQKGVDSPSQRRYLQYFSMFRYGALASHSSPVRQRSTLASRGASITTRNNEEEEKWDIARLFISGMFVQLRSLTLHAHFHADRLQLSPKSTRQLRGASTSPKSQQSVSSASELGGTGCE
jgi:hypothetical protein